MEDIVIKNLLATSKKVISDCCLSNGAIVAADSTQPYYPKQAKNYFYVWPRDSAFICMAAGVLGMKNEEEKFFSWLMNRAEGWEETGLFYEKYYPNGSQALNRFQPDQTGTILYALCRYIKENQSREEKFQKLVANSAEGICRVWDFDHFTLVTNDIWEEKLAFPDMKENFSYSVAACASGLAAAGELLREKRYTEKAAEMREALFKNAAARGHFFRSFGEISDFRVDASLLGIFWPFEVIGLDNYMVKKTVMMIEERIVKDYGVYRYENDEYDGWMFQTMHRKKGAGYWPLLCFWMSIVQKRMNQGEEAMQYYKKAMSSVEEFIPEQVFDNNIQKAISPLCWSHAMFVLATKELGLI
jgi:GH15 family glucan-1,4-alpha-glucosidase